MTTDASGLARRLAGVREAVEEARTTAGRTDPVKIVAVSKTVRLEAIRVAYAAGQHLFGENRVQEAVAKIEALSDELSMARWHMIGHLQSNKARMAARRFDVIESVDSFKLAGLLDAAAASAGRLLPILLEVNVAGEASKHGVQADSLAELVPGLLELGHLQLRGLMTVAPLAADPEDVRWVFRRLRELRDDLRERFRLVELQELSMGMSGDFRVAIEEGATMVRIGRAIFGERPVVPG